MKKEFVQPHNKGVKAKETYNKILNSQEKVHMK